MAKKLLLVTLLLPLLAGCSMSIDYTPKSPYPGVIEAHDDSDTSGGEGGGGEELPMRVNFFLSFSNSDEPIHTLDWVMLKPIGECPELAQLTDADAPDALYPHFIGYSEYSSCMDETLLWDFAKDYKQSNILNLYGVWVSNS